MSGKGLCQFHPRIGQERFNGTQYREGVAGHQGRTEEAGVTRASAGRRPVARSQKQPGPACHPADVGLHSDVLMISHSALKDRISPSSQSTYLPAVIKIAEPEAFQVPKWHFLSTKDKNYLKHNLHMCSYHLAQELDHAPNS